MAVGSGVGSQVGVAVESVYGTYVAPTRFYEVTKASVAKVKNTADWDGLAAGRLTNRADGRVVTSKAATGTIDELVVTDRDMGILLNLIMGGTVTPAGQGTSPIAYMDTFPLVDTVGKMATVQSGVPLIGGSVIPQSALGCKVTSAEFSCGVDDLLTVAVNFDGRDLTEAQSLAAASFGSPRKPFNFAQMGVKLGATVGGVAAVGGVRKCSVKIERALKTDQFYANNAGLKEQPTTNDKVKITGSLEVDYKTAADFADRFRDDTQASLVWEFLGAQINTLPSISTFRATIPALFFDTGTPGVDGPDVVNTTFNWTAYDDLSTGYPAKIEYLTADSAL
jgi:hypothetical protein